MVDERGALIGLVSGRVGGEFNYNTGTSGTVSSDVLDWLGL